MEMEYLLDYVVLILFFLRIFDQADRVL
jgi:hypothetical protein